MFLQCKSSNREPYSHGAQFCSAPSRVSSYKAHHGIAGDTLASASHPLWSPCSFARSKKLRKHPHKSFFSICNNPFNLSFLAQHPNSRSNCSSATAHRDSCLPRDLLAVLGGFTPHLLDDVPETSPLTTPDGHTHSYHLHRDKLTLTPNLNVSSGVFPFGCVRDATLIPMQTAP